MHTSHRERRVSRFILWPACALLLFVFYLASYGPFVWLGERDWFPADLWFSCYRIYFPIIYTLEQPFFDDSWAAEMYSRYLEMWQSQDSI